MRIIVASIFGKRISILSSLSTAIGGNDSASESINLQRVLISVSISHIVGACNKESTPRVLRSHSAVSSRSSHYIPRTVSIDLKSGASLNFRENWQDAFTPHDSNFQA